MRTIIQTKENYTKLGTNGEFHGKYVFDDEIPFQLRAGDMINFNGSLNERVKSVEYSFAGKPYQFVIIEALFEERNYAEIQIRPTA